MYANSNRQQLGEFLAILNFLCPFSSLWGSHLGCKQWALRGEREREREREKKRGRKKDT